MFDTPKCSQNTASLKSRCLGLPLLLNEVPKIYLKTDVGAFLLGRRHGILDRLGTGKPGNRETKEYRTEVILVLYGEYGMKPKGLTGWSPCERLEHGQVALLGRTPGPHVPNLSWDQQHKRHTIFTYTHNTKFLESERGPHFYRFWEKSITRPRFIYIYTRCDRLLFLREPIPGKLQGEIPWKQGGHLLYLLNPILNSL